jgi:hypothetical protein
MEPKTEDGIHEVFGMLVCDLMEEFDDLYFLNYITLKFTDHRCSFCKTWDGELYFSTPAYEYDVRNRCTSEYKMVLRKLGNMPYFSDSSGEWVILTDEPEKWTILHEFSHIIAEEKYGGPLVKMEPHGKEFCEIYGHLLNFVQPNVLNPFGITFKWSE